MAFANFEFELCKPVLIVRLVAPLFDSVLLLVDPTPHPGALNMAIDELLLGNVTEPLLRVYKWARPTVSFGYFEKCEHVRGLYPQWGHVRRWTGGGIVEHGADFTYSLIVPAKHPFLEWKTADSYEKIHVRVVQALRSCGFEPEVAPEEAPKISQACFENPTRHDVLIGGKKVAGAAQRRCRHGLLHQGSIQVEALGAAFLKALVAELANSAGAYELDDSMHDAASELAANKYGSEHWAQKF